MAKEDSTCPMGRATSTLMESFMRGLTAGCGESFKTISLMLNCQTGSS